MRKLIVEEWISLDGYVSDKESKLDFFARHVRQSYADESRLEFLNKLIQYYSAVKRMINLLPCGLIGQLKKKPWQRK
jgi:hypothetical protein